MAVGSLFLLVLLSTAVVLVVQCSSSEQLQGKFETRDGSLCVWFELRKSGRGNVFVTACHCKNAEGHRQSYSCEYDGPVQECEAFQNDPKEFYNMVAASLHENYDNPCELPSISVTQCPDVVLQKSKGTDLASPCVPEPKDEL